MRTPTFHARLAAFIAVCIALCAVQAFGDQAPFVPPFGWVSSKPPQGMLGVWIHPGDTSFHQNLVLGAERTKLSADQYDKMALAQLSRGLNGFRVGADESTTTCGGQPAHYISYASTINGKQVLYEQMTTMVSGVEWFVIYTRLMSQPSLPEARQALTTLCGLHQSQSVAIPQAQVATPPPAPEAEATTPPPSPYATMAPFPDAR